MNKEVRIIEEPSLYRFSILTTDFPIKDARLSKLKIFLILSDDRKLKGTENIDFKYLTIVRLLWETLYE